MKYEKFDGLRRGPEVLSQVRLAIDEASIHASIPDIIGQTLAQADYRLSPTQKDMIEMALPQIIEHKKAAGRAKNNARKWKPREQLKVSVARALGTKPDQIAGFHFHPASLTAVIQQEEFDRLYQIAAQGDGIEDREKASAGGFTSPAYQVQIKRGFLPISLMGKASGDKHTAQHEDFHVQYRYLHPGDRESTGLSYKEYLENVEKEAKEKIEKQDACGFTQLVKETTHGLLQTYLNELSSYSLDGRQDVYQMFFRGENPLYGSIRKTLQERLYSPIPKSPAERVMWGEIIFTEFQRAQSQARFIHDEYRKLLTLGAQGEELASIIQFLTPDRAYIIKTYTDGTPTFAKLKNN